MCRRRSEIIIVFIFLYFYLMGGVFGKAVEPDYNFKQGTEFATNFFILWPDDVPMTFSPTATTLRAT